MALQKFSSSPVTRRRGDEAVTSGTTLSYRLPDELHRQDSQRELDEAAGRHLRADIMLRTLDCCRPGLPRARHGRIEPDGKEYLPPLLALALEARLDFILHPVAANRMFRQDQKQLVVFPDCVVDALPKFLADLNVLGCEPTPHAVVFEIGMQPRGERGILARISDKT